MTGVFDRAIERLPGLADDVLVGCDGTFGGYAQCVGLDPHVSGELPLAVGGTVITDGAVEIFVTGVVRGLGRGVARFGDGLAVELVRRRMI
ncbi:hypothetical protein GB927_033935 [Shinella sp. CPCC 100929]|uniref:Uncharacterized protein n=1 Tax=Shinella lacus TaxID=2654216 RepID=A0ABT1RIQ7_9HYPH|nr:hypothetical protein [Shinella lacus]